MRILAIARTPTFPWRRTDNQLLKISELFDLCPQNVLREAVSAASPNLLADIDRHPDRSREKLELYQLRMAQRCIPFGLFAQMGAVLTGEPASVGKPEIMTAMRPSSSSRDRIRRDRELPPAEAIIKANPSLDFQGGAYRFDSYGATGALTKRTASDHMELLREVWDARAISLGELAASANYAEAGLINLIEMGALHVVLADVDPVLQVLRIEPER